MVDVVVYQDDGGLVRAVTPPTGLRDMTAAEIAADPEYVPQDRPHHIVDNSALPTTDPRLWHLHDDGTVTSDAPAAPRITVSRLRFMLQLTDAGLLAAVKAGVASAGTIAQLYWDEASDFESDHPLVASIGAAIGLSPTQIRTMFEAARDRSA